MPDISPVLPTLRPVRGPDLSFLGVGPVPSPWNLSCIAPSSLKPCLKQARTLAIAYVKQPEGGGVDVPLWMSHLILWMSRCPTLDKKKL